jgi:hypothetical protein
METEITQEDVVKSEAVNGLMIDTTKLDVGNDDESSNRITFEGVK